LWRHPAEVGAETNLARREIPAAPPLRRRTTALVAAASVCASVLLLAVVLPSRVDPPTDQAGPEIADNRTATDQPAVDPPTGPSAGAESAAGTRVKNAELATDVAVDGTLIAVVTVGEGLLATSSDALGTGPTARFTINGTLVATTVVGIDDRTGLAFLSVDGWPGRSVLETIPPAVVAESVMVTVDAEGRIVMCQPSLGSPERTDSDRTPISMESAITGASVVRDALDAPLGVAVSRTDGTWMLSRTAIEAALARAVAPG